MREQSLVEISIEFKSPLVDALINTLMFLLGQLKLMDDSGIKARGLEGCWDLESRKSLRLWLLLAKNSLNQFTLI